MTEDKGLCKMLKGICSVSNILYLYFVSMIIYIHTFFVTINYYCDKELKILNIYLRYDIVIGFLYNIHVMKKSPSQLLRTILSA